jgi:hypothetical protein
MSGMKEECLFSPVLLSIMLEFLARVIRQENERKMTQIEIKESNYLY